MPSLTATAAKDAAARAYDELELPVGAPLEQVAASFRAKCVHRAVRVLSGSFSSDDDEDDDSQEGGDNQRTDDPDGGRFERQAVAYRFLASLPLLSDREEQATGLLATLRPLRPAPEHLNARASAMLDVAIPRVERAQRAFGLPYANYVLSVHYCLRRHVVRRRYREFRALHDALVTQLPVLPELPPKDWRCSLGGRPTLVVARAGVLARYLARVLALLAARGRFSLDVMSFLEIDHARVRAEEEARAVALLANAPSKSLFYIVDASWLEAWKRFVAEAAAPPGRITNDRLLERDAKTRRSKMKDQLAPAQHYRCVNAATWTYLHAVYSGGPALARRSPSVYAAPVCDLATLATHAQRLVRGFLVRCEARRRRNEQLCRRPDVARLLIDRVRAQELEKRMEAVRGFVRVREFQARQAAARVIQRAYRRHNAREEHSLLLAESAAPDGAALDLIAQLDEHLTLAEIGLLPASPNEAVDLRTAHLLAALTHGVPLRKLRSRRKLPKWRLFSMDAIGAQLLWTSKRLQRRQQRRRFVLASAMDASTTRSLAFVDVLEVCTESPLKLKRPLFPSAASSQRAATCEFAVVLQYHESVDDDEGSDTKEQPAATASGSTMELILVCESAGEMNALHCGLRALVDEAAGRVAGGATYVDGHGVIRKKVPHAKRLLRAAHERLAKETARG